MMNIKGILTISLINIRNILGFPTMNCKISWFGVVRYFYISFYISVQSFDRTKLLSLPTWKIWKGEGRIVER